MIADSPQQNPASTTPSVARVMTRVSVAGATLGWSRLRLRLIDLRLIGLRLHAAHAQVCLI